MVFGIIDFLQKMYERIRLYYYDKVHIFWEGHKIFQNLHLTFDYSTYNQKLGEDFAKFCGLLRIYELYEFKWKMYIGYFFQMDLYTNC